jgi:pyocin large subunit-like protein
MKYFGRSFIFGFLFFFVIGIFAYADIKAGDFAPGQLEAHYLKHGDQFGNITQEQYLQGARALLDAVAEGDVLEKVRQNGDVERYRASTGEFAVMTKRGRIRTYFKTDYGYWLKQ